MKEIHKQVLEKVPPNLAVITRLYPGNKVTIFHPDFILPTQVQIDLYEFLVTLIDTPIVNIDNRRLTLDKNTVFPINPGQLHGGALDYEVPCDYLVVFIERSFMQEVAKTLYGQREIVFENAGFPYDKEISYLLQTFINEAIHKQLGYEMILQSLSIQISVTFLRKGKTNIRDTKTDQKGQKNQKYSSREPLQKAIEFLQERYNQDYSLEEVASLVNLSPYHFIRVFKSYTGKTPYEYLVDVKIEKAKELLQFSDHTITDISYQCGFNNHSHFTTVFKKSTGVTPTQYRRGFLLK